MKNEVIPSPTTAEPMTRVKMVNISLLFVADSDEEILAVKNAIDTAIAPYPKITLNFAMQERLAPVRNG